METKLSRRRRFSPPEVRRPNPANIFLSSQRFSLKSWIGFRNKQFRGVTERVQEMPENQKTTKHYLVHAVKRGETLNSIGKQYGASVDRLAAANKGVDDLDLVHGGQLVFVPSSFESFPTETDACRTRQSSDLPLEENHEETVSTSDNLAGQNGFFHRTRNSFPNAKTGGYFLLLVPLAVLCIRCIIGALHRRVVRALEHSSANKSEGHQITRWRSVLADSEEPISYNPASRPDYRINVEDEPQDSSEEVSQAYSKVERDYQKFLSECGMSEYGDWRGGSFDQ